MARRTFGNRNRSRGPEQIPSPAASLNANRDLAEPPVADPFEQLGQFVRKRSVSVGLVALGLGSATIVALDPAGARCDAERVDAVTREEAGCNDRYLSSRGRYYRFYRDQDGTIKTRAIVRRNGFGRGWGFFGG
jgi:hypothetical protein